MKIVITQNWLKTLFDMLIRLDTPLPLVNIYTYMCDFARMRNLPYTKSRIFNDRPIVAQLCSIVVDKPDLSTKHALPSMRSLQLFSAVF